MLSQMRSSAANKTAEDDGISDSDNMAEKTNWKYYHAKAGDPCADPFSCPSCSGVLFEPVSLPCGHTFCRTHVMSNTANPSLCLKVRIILCKTPWKYGFRIYPQQFEKLNYTTSPQNHLHQHPTYILADFYKLLKFKSCIFTSFSNACQSKIRTNVTEVEVTINYVLLRLSACASAR